MTAATDACHQSATPIVTLSKTALNTQSSELNWTKPTWKKQRRKKLRAGLRIKRQEEFIPLNEEGGRNVESDRISNPCKTCQKADPMYCEAKGCGPWRVWFVHKWAEFNNYYKKYAKKGGESVAGEGVRSEE